MRKVLGYGPWSILPYIPSYISTETGIFNRNGKPLDGLVLHCSPISISENEWVGVNYKGEVESFKNSEEINWRRKAAMAAIANMEDSLSPESKIDIIRSSANLMNVDLSSLLKELDSRRGDGETLVDSFLKMKKGKK